MKIKFTTLVLLWSALSFAQVGIGTTSPNASAILDLTSTTKGFLPPRMTTSERDAITNPETGLTIYNTTVNFIQFYNGTQWTYSGTITLSPTDVYNPTTGKLWMARNLGATQIATSSTDHLAYGSLFQWGRAADGHQLITWTSATEGTGTNGTTNSAFDTNNPISNLFSLSSGSSSGDWCISSNNDLWQGVNGINNPCPNGYRIPTLAEWEAEKATWTSQNAAGAFASQLKLPLPGYRDNYASGQVLEESISGQYWSSSIEVITIPGGTYYQSYYLAINESNIYGNSFYRAVGGSIRCIKN